MTDFAIFLQYYDDSELHWKCDEKLKVCSQHNSQQTEKNKKSTEATIQAKCKINRLKKENVQADRQIRVLSVLILV